MSASLKTWDCQVCTYVNQHDRKKAIQACEVCSTPRGETSPSHWSCFICTFANDQNTDICAVCGTPKDGTSPTSSPAPNNPSTVKPGYTVDKSAWICHCTTRNNVDDEACIVCSTSKITCVTEGPNDVNGGDASSPINGGQGRSARDDPLTRRTEGKEAEGRRSLGGMGDLGSLLKIAAKKGGVTGRGGIRTMGGRAGGRLVRGEDDRNGEEDDENDDEQDDPSLNNRASNGNISISGVDGGDISSAGEGVVGDDGEGGSGGGVEEEEVVTRHVCDYNTDWCMPVSDARVDALVRWLSKGVALEGSQSVVGDTTQTDITQYDKEYIPSFLTAIKTTIKNSPAVSSTTPLLTSANDMANYATAAADTNTANATASTCPSVGITTNANTTTNTLPLSPFQSSPSEQSELKTSMTDNPVTSSLSSSTSTSSLPSLLTPKLLHQHLSHLHSLASISFTPSAFSAAPSYKSSSIPSFDPLSIKQVQGILAECPELDKMLDQHGHNPVSSMITSTLAQGKVTNIHLQLLLL